MRAEAVAAPFDLDANGAAQEPVEKRGRNDRVVEDLASFCEASVIAQDHGFLFVSYVSQLEDQVCVALGDGQAADLVHCPSGDCKAICQQGTISRDARS